MNKDLKYYLSLDYTLEIRKLTKEDGGGYLASIPQLGAKAFCGDGRTIEEALTNLNKIKEDLFRDYLNKGIPIPEPEVEPESIFSGKFVVRIPPVLHRQLVERAREENISLNQFIVYLLSYNIPLTAVERKLEECFGKIERKMSVFQVPFEFPPETIKYLFAGKRIGATAY